MRKSLLVGYSLLGGIGVIIFIRLTNIPDGVKTCISMIGGLIVAIAFWKLYSFLEEKMSKTAAEEWIHLDQEGVGIFLVKSIVLIALAAGRVLIAIGLFIVIWMFASVFLMWIMGV